jgi:hypothetical protein
MRPPNSPQPGRVVVPHNSRKLSKKRFDDANLDRILGFENLCAASSNAMGNLSQILGIGDTRERARRRHNQATEQQC